MKIASAFLILALVPAASLAGQDCRDLFAGSSTLKIRSADMIHEVQTLVYQPSAQSNKEIFWARVRIDQTNRSEQIELFPANDPAVIAKLAEDPLRLVWSTYGAQGTVPRAELESFQKTESALPDLRKIQFIKRARDGRVLSVMRMFDGSPLPGLIRSGFADYHYAKDDDRLPIERRYPELNFRERSNFIYELGRAAKVDGVENTLPELFTDTARYFANKFRPQSHFEPREENLIRDFAEGMIYAEVTAKNVEYLLRDTQERGLFMELIATKQGNRPMTLVRRGTQLTSLKFDSENKADRYVIGAKIGNFIAFHLYNY